MAGFWLKIVVCLVFVGFGRGQDDCYYGNTRISKSLYSHLIGWSCFEHVGYNASDSVMYACVSDDGFKVPCLRNGDRYLDFSSEISRQHLLKVSAKDAELTECIKKNSACGINPNSDSMTRVWIPASVCDSEPRNKFHIAMLSISFIMGIPAFMFLIYFSITDNTHITLFLHRNLICAITFRSLMTLLIQTEIILPKSEGSNSINLEGIPALATFETLTLDLVLGFWMVETMALWKIITNEHGIPLRVNIYTYASIGLSLSFTLIWIIVMASTQDLENWIGVRYWAQWLNEPLRIIFLVFQIGLIFYSAKKIFWDAKSPLEKHDATSSRRVRLETLYVLILTPIFILQFCLNAGSPNGVECSEAFFYVFFFIDGIQGALICLFFFYINSEVKVKFITLFGLDAKETTPAPQIRTLDSLRDRPGNESNDVVYSSVLDPERHAKMLQLYQKRNLIPLPSVTVVEGEEFVSCAERKISTATVFYDAVSFEEEDALVALPDAVPQSRKDALVALRDAVPQSRKVSEPLTPVLDSKYSSVGQSLSSTSSNSGSFNRHGSLVRNDSTEAVRSSMPEDFTVTPRILLTQPTVEGSSSEDTPPVDVKPMGLIKFIKLDNLRLESKVPPLQMDSEKFDSGPTLMTAVGKPKFDTGGGDTINREMTPFSRDSNIRYSSSDSEYSGPTRKPRLAPHIDNLELQMAQISRDSNIRYSSPDSDTSSTKEFRMRLNQELDDVLDNLSSTAKAPYVYNYQHEDSISSYDSQEVNYDDEDGKRIDSSSNGDKIDNSNSEERLENLPSEYSGGDENNRPVLRLSSETNDGILDDLRKPYESEDSEKNQYYESSSSNSDTDGYSDDERVPESILNLLLSRKPAEPDDLTKTEGNSSENLGKDDENSESFEYSTKNPETETHVENTAIPRHPEEIRASFSSNSSEHSDNEGSKSFEYSNNPKTESKLEKVPVPSIRVKIQTSSSKDSIENSNVRNPESFEYSTNDSETDSRVENTPLPRHPKEIRSSFSSNSSEHSDDEGSKPLEYSTNLKTVSNLENVPLPSIRGKIQTSSSNDVIEHSDIRIPESFEYSTKNPETETNAENTPLPRHPKEIRASLSSDSSEHSDNESSKSFEYSTNQKTDPNFQTVRRGKTLTSSSSEDSDHENAEYSTKTPEDQLKARELTKLGERQESQPGNTYAQTLPRSSEPVAKPRPLSLSEERRTKFSTMFSKHRDKVLSSRSEDVDDGKPTMRKFPGFDNLSSTEVFGQGSSTPSTITADNSDADEEWLPQNVHFADN